MGKNKKRRKPSTNTAPIGNVKNTVEKDFDLTIREKIRSLENLFPNQDKYEQSREKKREVERKKQKEEASGILHSARIKTEQKKIDKEKRKTLKYEDKIKQYTRKRDEFFQYLKEKRSSQTIETYFSLIDAYTNSHDLRKDLKQSIQKFNENIESVCTNEQVIGNQNEIEVTIQKLNEALPELRASNPRASRLSVSSPHYQNQSIFSDFNTLEKLSETTAQVNLATGASVQMHSAHNEFAEEFFDQLDFFQNFSKQKETKFDETKLIKGVELSILHALVRQIYRLISDDKVLDKENELYSFSKEDFYNLYSYIGLHVPQDTWNAIYSFEPIWLHCFEKSPDDQLYLAIFKNSTLNQIVIIASSDANIDSFVPVLQADSNNNCLHVKYNELGSCFLQTLKQIWLGNGFPQICFVDFQKHFVLDRFIQEAKETKIQQTNKTTILHNDFISKLSEMLFLSKTIPDLYFYAEGIHPLFINYLLSQVYSQDGLYLFEPSFKKGQTSTLNRYSPFIVVPTDFVKTYGITPNSSNEQKLELSKLFQLDCRSKKKDSLLYCKIADQESQKPYDKLPTLDHPMPDTNFFLDIIDESVNTKVDISMTARDALTHGHFFLFADKFFFGSYQSQGKTYKITLPLQYTPTGKQPLNMNECNKSFFFECVKIFTQNNSFSCFYPFLFIVRDNITKNPHMPLLASIYFVLQKTIYRLREKINFYHHYISHNEDEQNNGYLLNKLEFESSEFQNIFLNYFMYYQIDLIRQLENLKITISPLVVFWEKDLWFESFHKNQHELASLNDCCQQYLVLMNKKPLPDHSVCNKNISNLDEQKASIKQFLCAFIQTKYEKYGLGAIFRTTKQSHKKETDRSMSKEFLLHQAKINPSELDLETASAEKKYSQPLQPSTSIQISMPSSQQHIDPSQSHQNQSELDVKQYVDLEESDKNKLRKYFKDNEKDAKNAIVINGNKVLYSKKIEKPKKIIETERITRL